MIHNPRFLGLILLDLIFYLGKLVLDKIFQEFPPALFELSHLKFLALNSNYVESLPEEIGKLSKLESLWCNWNTELKSIPPAIAKLTQLKKLMLGKSGHTYWDFLQISSGAVRI